MLQGLYGSESPFGQAALVPPRHGTMRRMLSESRFGRTPTRRQRHCRWYFPEIEVKNGHDVIMLLDLQCTAQDDEGLLGSLPISARRHLVTQLSRRAGHVGCPYIYGDNVAAACGGWDAGVFKEIGAFQTRPLRPQARGGAGWVRSRFGARLSAPGQRLADACVPAQAGSKNGLSLLSRPTVLLQDTSRDGGRLSGQALRSTSWSMSSLDNLTVVGAWDREGELNFPKNDEKKNSTRFDAEPDRVRVPLLALSYSVSDLKIPRGPACE